MKIIQIFLLACFGFVGAQNFQKQEKLVESNFRKISYWSEHESTNFDSLKTANQKFEKQLLKLTAENPKSIQYHFESLTNEGLRIATSEDRNFRIYSWNTMTGGTMHFFRNIYQYKSNQKVASEVQHYSTNDAGVFYYQIYDLHVGIKKYYLALSKAILSTGLTYHNVKVFSIENGRLNKDAKLIKTATGIRNQLGYEVDLTASSNKNKEIPNHEISYDTKNKVISIPLILENSKVTGKRIQYQFNGRYFEKI